MTEMLKRQLLFKASLFCSHAWYCYLSILRNIWEWFYRGCVALGSSILWTVWLREDVWKPFQQGKSTFYLEFGHTWIHHWTKLWYHPDTPLFLTLNPQLWVLLFSVCALSWGWLWCSESSRIINWLRVPLSFKITTDNSSILFLFNYSFIILNVVSQSDSFREEREKGGKEGEKKGRLVPLHFQRQIYLQMSVLPQLPTSCYG